MSQSAEKKIKPGKALGIFALVMITITSVDSIRNLPTTALFGGQMIVFFIISGIGFLIPSALVASELASTWPKTGGIYVWVRQAFGKRFGLLAIWFQWIENVIWYPAILSTLGGTLAYLIHPALASNKYFLMASINILFWGLTLLNLAGIKFSAAFSAFCGIAGLLLPMGLIILLGIIWVVTGHDLQLTFTTSSFTPNFHDPGSLVSLTAVILCFSGMEIATAHAQDVENPKRAYPIALIISVMIIFTTMLLGSLAIALIVPNQQLSLVAGIMQAIQAFFDTYNLSFLIPIMALCIILGTMGSVSNWIIAPNRGLLVALKESDIAHFLHRENNKNAPSSLLITQGILVSLITSIFIFMPNVNSSYWLLTVMASQLYMGMYILMFVAVVALRLKYPAIERPFKIPGGLPGVLLIGGLGLIISIFNLCIGFFPPSDLDVGSARNYEIILISGIVIMSCPPFFMFWLRNLRKGTGAIDNGKEPI